MSILARRLLRDVRSHAAQFLSVLAMTVLSIGVFGGLDGTWRGMQAAIDVLDAERGMPTLWVTTTGTTEEDIAALRARDGVTDADRVTSAVAFHDRGDDTAGVLTTTTVSGSSVDVPTVVSGAAVDRDDDGGIWIDSRYAAANFLEAGDEVTISIGPAAADLVVRGLIVLPDGMVFTGPGLASRDPGDYGQAVVSPATALSRFGVPDVGDTVRVVGDESAADAVATVLADRVISTVDRELNVFVAPAFDRVEQLRTLSIMFSALFVLVALLAMSTSVRRLVDLQRADIAALRALGFSAAAVGAYFSAVAGLVVGAGAVLGLLLAPVMSRFIIATQSGEFALVSWEPVLDVSVPLVALGLVLVCMAGAWTASRASRRMSPADALRPAVRGPRGAARLLGGRSLPRLAEGTRWTLRDALSSPARPVMGIVAAAGCMMLLAVGFGMPETLGRAISVAYSDQYRYRTWIVADPSATQEERAQLAATAGPGQWIMQGYVDVGDAPADTRVLTVLDAGDLFVLRDADGARLDLDGGGAVSQAVAADLDLGAGDTASIAGASPEPVALPLVAVADLSLPQGVLVSRAAWERAGGSFAPTAYLAEAEVSSADLAALPAAAGLAARERQEQNALNVVVSLGGVFALMKVFAVLLAVVSLYNLGALSFSERTRDYATLRVLGFENRALRRLALLENGLTTAIGWGIGIPLGFWFLSLFSSVFSTFRAVYPPYITPGSLALISAITIVASLSTTLLLTRRIRRIDMASALKGVE